MKEILHNAPFGRRRHGDAGHVLLAAGLCFVALLAFGSWAPAGDSDRPPGRLAEGQQGTVIQIPRHGRITVDVARAARFGISPQEIARQLRTRLNQPGAPVADIGKVLLVTKDGKLVRLGDVAAVHGAGAPPEQPGKTARSDGRIKSPTLTKAFAALWPRLAAVRSKAAGSELPPALTPQVLARVTDVAEAFWVTPEQEKRFRAARFDDEHNAKRLILAVERYSKRAAQLPVALRFLYEECRAGRLKGAHLAIGGRLITDFFLQERERGKLLARSPGGSKLALRIAPARRGAKQKPALSEAEMARYTKDLAAHGPQAGRKRGDEYVWFELKCKPHCDALILAAHTGKRYALLWNRPPYVMLPKADGPDAWRIVRAFGSADRFGKRRVAVEFDEAGSKRFASLTAKNKGGQLACVVDGEVRLVAMIPQAMSGHVVAADGLSRKEARELVWALERGMKPPAKKPHKTPEK